MSKSRVKSERKGIREAGGKAQRSTGSSGRENDVKTMPTVSSAKSRGQRKRTEAKGRYVRQKELTEIYKRETAASRYSKKHGKALADLSSIEKAFQEAHERVVQNQGRKVHANTASTSGVCQHMQSSQECRLSECS